MILLEEAYKIIMDSAFELNHKKVELSKVLNRILAEDVISDINMPPFDKSAMDGYACRLEDIKNELEVIEIIPAGKPPQKIISKNLCSKIMTGAMIPQGADCVIMVEHTEISPDKKVRFVKETTNKNIAYKSEDVKIGDIVLRKGTLIKPQHIAVLASVGCINPIVFKQARVGIISTGDEIVEPKYKPGLSQIRNSNAFQLIAQVEKMGAIPKYFGIIKDDEQKSYKSIEKAIKGCDVLLLTGGVSMGDFDFIPKILDKLKVRQLFQKLAIKPGKPTIFGIRDKKFVFGLPGNPVSSFNIFELLTKPFIYKMMGFDYKPLNIKMPLGKTYKRKKSDRKSFIPVKIKNGFVFLLEYHGSAHINALSDADGLIAVPIGKTVLNKGDLTDVRQI